MEFIITGENVSLETIKGLQKSNEKIALSKNLREAVINCRNFLERHISETKKPIYGVNTGFGSLCDTSISGDQISQLQINLVLSHACGTGDVIPQEISRLILLLKIINLSLGYSGVRIETIDNLIAMYNAGISPVIYEIGSLGASGDLSPLAHLSLPLLHKGEVWYKGERRESAKVMQNNNIDVTELSAKEGLALLNGTQFMSAYASQILNDLHSLFQQSNIIAAASLDAFNCSLDPFRPQIHKVRSHNGQVEIAERITTILKGSEISSGSKPYVQDPYSFRCIPQVHGASLDTYKYVRSVVEKEIQSVTDNPVIFPEEALILSAGNFHGQPLALALDFLAIAISEMASISERRVYKLISGQRGLPPFLTPSPGLHSGFMIPQYTAAAMVSQNKQFCTPSSVDTIDSSNGQEDHVSMGANAALKCLRVLKNYKRVLAIELLNASQALEFRKPLRSSEEVENYFNEYRKIVPFQKKDDEWYKLMRLSEGYIDSRI